MSKITDGQGLPWPKPAYLKRLAYQERSRVVLLRLLEEKLGIRESGEMVMATSEQIIAVVRERGREGRDGGRVGEEVRAEGRRCYGGEWWSVWRVEDLGVGWEGLERGKGIGREVESLWRDSLSPH